MFDDGRSWSWLNEPEHLVRDGKLELTTRGNTDLWQRTHYGFSRDNAHCLLTPVERDFSLSVRCTSFPKSRFDQCGAMVRTDGQNWIKVSIEYESETVARLGSVVTNLGYSDWATTDIDPSVTGMWYRIQSRGSDFLLESSEDGTVWRRMRIAHLHVHDGPVLTGVYACSPNEGGALAVFDHLVIAPGEWKA